MGDDNGKSADPLDLAADPGDPIGQPRLVPVAEVGTLAVARSRSQTVCQWPGPEECRPGMIRQAIATGSHKVSHSLNSYRLGE